MLNIILLVLIFSIVITNLILLLKKNDTEEIITNLILLLKKKEEIEIVQPTQDKPTPPQEGDGVIFMTQERDMQLLEEEND
jgi:hypothetical protein